MGSPQVAILGGRGMLGSDLAVACGLVGLDATVYDLPEFDITHADHIRQAIAR